MLTSNESAIAIETPLGFPPTTIAVFVCLVLAALTIDLISHRKNKPISLLNASLWSIFWVLISMVFAGYLYLSHGASTASLFITGYTLEKVLSIDNLFVFMAIFTWFKIPDALRHRVLYWGIIGAVVFRMVFVFIGTGLLAFGPWVELAFAAIVIWTAVMMIRSGNEEDKEEDYSDHIAYKIAKKLFPTWPFLYGEKFFVHRKLLEADTNEIDGKKSLLAKKGTFFATPLFLCVCVVEVSDVLFAFDSVPAIIAVSREPLIIYSAMLFAILGLRTLYFVLEALKDYLIHLEKAVIALLFFIGVKLALNASVDLFQFGYSIDPNTSLFIVLGVLSIGIIASILFPERKSE